MISTTFDTVIGWSNFLALEGWGIRILNSNLERICRSSLPRSSRPCSCNSPLKVSKQAFCRRLRVYSSATYKDLRFAVVAASDTLRSSHVTNLKNKDCRISNLIHFIGTEIIFPIREIFVGFIYTFWYSLLSTSSILEQGVHRALIE